MSPDLYSIALGKFDKYKIELKNMKADSVKYEFTLDNQFFVDLDGPEVQKGKLAVELNVNCLLYTSPSSRDPKTSRMPSSA